ncbi:hypothetical protein ACQQ2N_18080 [Dokdonella sp. MW10]|uniref:hypothetical protein n=1 Tax=Dokdonella sp. MW10 TaxID=2992926 RepID=UPI003F8103C8
MRKADVDDAWKHCRSSAAKDLFVRSIEYNNDGDIESVSIESRVTALLGANGVGKTGALLAMEGILNRRAYHDRSPVVRLRGSYRGKDFTIPQDESDAEITVVYSDVSRDVNYIRSRIHKMSDIDQFIKEAGSRVLTGKDADFLCHVACQSYTEISVSEIILPDDKGIESEPDDSEQDESVFPFFKVVTQSRAYDSRGMGFGEYCAFYTIWLMRRADKHTVILLDEPDSHLSSESRRGLIDSMAVIANDRKLMIFFSSHSAEPMYSMRESDLCLVYVKADVARSTLLANVKERRQLIRPLRLLSTKCLLIIVEDVDAQEAIKQIVFNFSGDLSRWVDVQIVAGGDSEVVKFVEKFPKKSVICGIIGVLDGDKREHGECASLDYLPGLHDPMNASRSFIRDRPEVLAASLGIEAARIVDAMMDIGHRDYHDFPSDLRGALGIGDQSIEIIRSKIIAAWLTDSEISAAGKELAARIFALASSRPLSLD